jgi:hypothetical protein
MSKQVYIVEGEGLPPKLAIVDFSLEHSTLFEIENRFERGSKYTTLKSIEAGMLLLADPKHGRYDSAFLPGTDDARAACSGAFPRNKPEVNEVSGELDGSRDVWELRYQGADGTTLTYMLVTRATGRPIASDMASALAQDFPEGTLELKRVSAGSYRLDAAIAAPGYRVSYRTVACV